MRCGLAVMALLASAACESATGPGVPAEYTLVAINDIPLPASLPGDTIKATFGAFGITRPEPGSALYGKSGLQYGYSVSTPESSNWLAGDYGVIREFGALYLVSVAGEMHCYSPSFPICRPPGNVILNVTEQTARITTTEYTLSFNRYQQQ